MIPLQWLLDDLASARKVLNREGGRCSPPSPSGWYVGATPIEADFDLSPETFAPYVTKTLDAMEAVEAAQGFVAGLVEIRAGEVLVF